RKRVPAKDFPYVLWTIGVRDRAGRLSRQQMQRKPAKDVGRGRKIGEQEVQPALADHLVAVVADEIDEIRARLVRERNAVLEENQEGPGLEVYVIDGPGPIRLHEDRGRLLPGLIHSSAIEVSEPGIERGIIHKRVRSIRMDGQRLDSVLGERRGLLCRTVVRIVQL